MDVMIDIETLSTDKTAVILTIGAIKFNRKEDPKSIDKMEKFYCRIVQDSCTKLGMTIDGSTQKWWDSQSEESKYETLLNPDRMDIQLALTNLSKFIGTSRYIWANSPNFDCVILENAYGLCNLKVPWKFWNLRDCRTIYDLASVNLKDISNPNAHHALYDCYYQILGVSKSMKNLKLIN